MFDGVDLDGGMGGGEGAGRLQVQAWGGRRGEALARSL